MESPFETLTNRLDTDPPGSAVEGAIRAAWNGPDSLDAFLAGGESAEPQPESAEPEPLTGVFLKTLKVEGFRGCGPATSLDLTPSPGLTLVVGRNGSGKSTFSEGLEVLLTGTTRRWEDKNKVWRDGWRNLQFIGDARVMAQFVIDGRQEPIILERRWAPGDDIDRINITINGKSTTSALTDLGWRTPLASYRPFLSYGELATLLTGRSSDLHDELQAILGLERMNEVQSTVRQARLRRDHLKKEAKQNLPELTALIADSEDERGRVVAAAIAHEPWDLRAIESAIGGDDDGDTEGQLRLLRELAGLVPPDEAAVETAVARLRRSAAAVASVQSSDPARALKLAGLLEKAAEIHDETHDPNCPVCGARGRLGGDWLAQTKASIVTLRADAAEYAKLLKGMKTAVSDALLLLGGPPRSLDRAADVGLNSEDLTRQWGAWAGIPDEVPPEDLAKHLESRIAKFRKAVIGFSKAAEAEIRRREDAWRPVAKRLREWLVVADQAAEVASSVETVSTAERWMKANIGALRDARIEPIFDEVQKHWTELRQNSSVTLYGLSLEGSSTQRHVQLDVQIDGREQASALGVMSQGELNCLALSIFLPRATLEESPFRFVVIDDPVQAMDPTKVDGLARVFNRISKSRQVVVLTHDERLPESVRRLDIPARVIEVTRREGSVIEKRDTLDPVSRAISDALAVASTDKLPERAARVVPGLCRLAVEAACQTSIRRRRILQGVSLSAVEDEFSNITTLTTWLAVAMFDSRSRGAEVLPGLNRKLGSWAGDALQWLKAGTHKAAEGELRQFVRSSERLARAARDFE